MLSNTYIYIILQSWYTETTQPVHGRICVSASRPAPSSPAPPRPVPSRPAPPRPAPPPSIDSPIQPIAGVMTRPHLCECAHPSPPRYISSPSRARPCQARPGRARPGQARPGQARPPGVMTRCSHSQWTLHLHLQRPSCSCPCLSHQVRMTPPLSTHSCRLWVADKGKRQS